MLYPTYSATLGDDRIALRVLLPFKYPIKSETLNFGGIATLKCT